VIRFKEEVDRAMQELAAISFLRCWSTGGLENEVFLQSPYMIALESHYNAGRRGPSLALGYLSHLCTIPLHHVELSHDGIW
jgi:hypothetical protein